MRKTLGLLLALVVAASVMPAASAGSEAGLSMETRRAREKFFGAENVDAAGYVRNDRVIFSWFSVSSFALAINGHVVLLDAWVARGSHSDYVPTTPEEVAALDPEYIFIGHGDFDHAADAAEIAARSGAPIVGTPEHCDSIKGQTDARITCIKAAPRNATPGIHTELNDLIPDVEISAIVHAHSSVESPEWDEGYMPCPPLWNAMDTVENPPTREDFEHLMRHLPDRRGGNVLYQFRFKDFSFAHHDTTGKIDKDAPAAVEAIRRLPETDVHFGAVLAFGQVTNCLRSLRLYIDALKPKVYAAMHHDNFTYFIGANARDLEPYVRDEIESIPERRRPALLYTYDPDDYLNHEVFTFDPRAPRWD